MRFFELALVKKDQRAVVADYYECRRIEMHEPIVTTQRPVIFTVQSM